MKKLLFGVLLTLSWGSFLQGQVTTPFKVRFQKVVHGNVAMLSNQIVNRIHVNVSANEPYLDRTTKSKINDEFIIRYVDIDQDPSTFSSSSADLGFNSESNKEIIYAGLYWSATYPYNVGTSPKVNEFVATDSGRQEINKILIKLPNQNSYQEVQGQIIFDGKENREFKETSPYVVYADVTKLLQTLKDASGTYTVANVRASNGKISGGIAAGWTMYVVYSDPSESPKFITTYDGFAGITKKEIDVRFENFPKLPNKEVKATIAGAALEGDLKLKGDQLLIKTNEFSDFIEIFNTLRERNNFFNSTISEDEIIAEKRKPNSNNTLGYDAFIMQIKDPKLISSNTKEVILRMKTSGDRFFMFFNAFSIEVLTTD